MGPSMPSCTLAATMGPPQHRSMTHHGPLTPLLQPRLLPSVSRNMTFSCSGSARRVEGTGEGRAARDGSRTRMKERLGWFAARGRLRLQRSFGSSDNLGSNLARMKEGLRRSRDRLGAALSPVRGRAG